MALMKFNWWYKIVARSLILLLEEKEENYNVILNGYINIVKTLKEEIKKAESDSAIAVKVIQERMRSGDMSCVLSSRDHAAKRRICELENSNSLQSTKINNLYNELERLKNKLAKFNQK